MNEKVARKIRQAIRNDLESRVKKEAWTFFSAVEQMDLKDRMKLAWTILFHKGAKNNVPMQRL